MQDIINRLKSEEETFEERLENKDDFRSEMCSKVKGYATEYLRDENWLKLEECAQFLSKYDGSIENTVNKTLSDVAQYINVSETIVEETSISGGVTLN